MFSRSKSFLAERILCLRNIVNLLLLHYSGKLWFLVIFEEKYGYFRAEIRMSEKIGAMVIESFAASPSKCIVINKCVSEYVERHCMELLLPGNHKIRSVIFDGARFEDLPCEDGIDLITGMVVPIPIQLLSRPDFNATIGKRLRPFNSSGMAAHISRQRALESALFELIERDALMCRWFCKDQPRVIRVESLAESAQRVIRRLKEQGIEVHVVDLATDIAVPVVAALACTVVSGEERWVGASAALYTYEEAVEKALDELHMLKENLYIDAIPHNNAYYYRGDRAQYIKWFVVGESIDMPRDFRVIDRTHTGLVRLLKDAGIAELSMYEYTSVPALSYIYALKVICPALCPFIFKTSDLPLCGTRLSRYCDANGLPKVFNQHVLFLN